MYQYLRSPKGFAPLERRKFIKKELNLWIKLHNTSYVIELENTLYNTVNNILSDNLVVVAGGDELEEENGADVDEKNEALNDQSTSYHFFPQIPVIFYYILFS
jgi:hypothetical protein